MLQRWLLGRGVRVGRVAVEDDILAAIGLLKPELVGHELVRIGGDVDGGYLVPDDLEGLAGCFSPGVCVTADFEEMLAERFGIRSYMADYSVEKPPFTNDLFDFEKKYLGLANDEIFIRLQDWMARKVGATPKGDLILQMDIEGGEFDVIIDTPTEVLKQFRIMVIEFHMMDMMFDRAALKLVTAIFKKLTKDFAVAHIHPNNFQTVHRFRDIEIPRVFEVTFLRRDRVKPGGGKLVFPHPLDRKNAPHLDEVVLPQVWR